MRLWLWALLTALPSFAAARMEVAEPRFVLGRTESSAVHFYVEEAEGEDERPLRVSVNVGRFEAVTREGPGHYRAVYVPPTTRFPQVALVAVWRETGPEAPIDFFRIPLHGVTKLPVSTKPRSNVTVELGDATFGPVEADAKGEAVVPLLVPPGVKEATVIAVDGTGAQTRGASVIDVPAYNRLTAALVPHAVVADGQARTRLEIFYDLGGADLPPEKVVVRASEGAPALEFAKEGRYVYRYTPNRGMGANAVTFKVSVEGDDASRAQAELTIGLPPPQRLILRPPAVALRSDGRSTADAEVLVFDDTGLGLPGQSVEVFGNGERAGVGRDVGFGRYVVTLTAPKRYPAGGLWQLAAKSGPLTTPSINYQLKPGPLPAGLTAQFSPTPVPADGRTQNEVLFRVRDEAGMPLDDAELIVSATDGALGTLEPLGNGRYRATYVATTEALAAEPKLRVVEPTGTFQTRITVPVRSNPGRFSLGVRAAVNHTLTELVTPRIGVDALAPFRLRGSWMSAGLSATFSRISQRHSTAGLSTRSDATMIPVALRGGLELYAQGTWSLTAGLGAQFTWVHFRTSISGAEESAAGLGALGFVMGNARLGPGTVFAEVSYAYAPVQGALFRLDAGGPGLAVGFRFGVW